MWENREMKVEEVILDLVNERFLIHGVTGLRKKAQNKHPHNSQRKMATGQNRLLRKMEPNEIHRKLCMLGGM